MPSDENNKKHSIFNILFGVWQWQPPTWLTAIAAIRSVYWWSLAGIAVLLISGIVTYSLLPKPLTYSSNVTLPRISIIDEEVISPQPLFIDFTVSENAGSARNNAPTSVASLKSLDKKVNDLIQMSPQLKGEWRWDSETRLIFKPEQDWPASNEYQLLMSPTLFADSILLDSYELSFTTLPLTLSIDNQRFYQNPQQPNQRSIVATIETSHPTDQQTLEQALTLSRQIKTYDGDMRSSLDFTLTAGPLNRRFYLTSQPLELEAEPYYIQTQLSAGVTSLTGTTAATKDLTESTFIPSASEYFKLDQLTTQIVRDEQGKPQQVLTLSMTDSVNFSDLYRELEVYALPKTDQQGNSLYWQSATEVNQSVLERSTRVQLTPNKQINDSGFDHSFIFDSPTAPHLFIKLNKGLLSDSGLALSRDAILLERAPNYPKEVNIVGEGSLLARSGDHQFSISTRGLSAIKVTINQIRSDYINHFVSQTTGSFTQPDWRNYSFDENNISRVSEIILPLTSNHPQDASYASVDLSKQLANKRTTPDGLFYIQVIGWDKKRKRRIWGAEDQRVILLTDLGLLLKRNADNSTDLFVQSLSAGKPADKITVQVLGKNGLPIIERTSDIDGHVSWPDLSSYKGATEPTLIMARKNNDLSFLPLNRYQTRLDFSQFAVGGEVTQFQNKNSLNAYVFSDRGIYRPGETVNLAAIVRQKDFRSVKDLPIEVRVINPRGQVFYRKHHKLTHSGMFDWQLKTDASDDTGQYEATLYLVNENNRRQYLGNRRFQLEMFQPDKLKIDSQIERAGKGWYALQQVDAQIKLNNLFGSPAQNRRITATAQLTSTEFQFKDYPGFVFTNPLSSDQEALRSQRIELPDTQTDNKGQATVSVDLDPFQPSTYRMELKVNGFDSGSGKSVSVTNQLLIAPIDYLVGHKADGELDYLKRDSRREVEFIQINPNLEKQNNNQLSVQLSRIDFISTLVKQADGTFAYQSVENVSVVNSSPFEINDSSTRLMLDTTKLGHYRLELLDNQGKSISRLNYHVVGDGNLAGALEQNALLNVALNKRDYKAGETIELQIEAPYKGSGVITIESDRVHHFQWFKSSTLRSLHRVKIPENLEGNAYINVAYVRAPDSPQIYTSPLSYAVMPFSLDRSARKLPVQLEVAKTTKPGEPLTIKYRSNRNADIILFAVDEGILQVANYKTPQPLNHFMKKRALEVDTSQIVDLILPEVSLWRQVSGVGGGSAADRLRSKLFNPFSQRSKPPVAFWSGINRADQNWKRVTFDIPDYFNGELRIMAVAVDQQTIGVAQDYVQVKGPFVLSPTLPTTAATNDLITVPLGIANLLELAENQTADIDITVSTKGPLSIQGDTVKQVKLASNAETTINFSLKTGEQFGSGSVTFYAKHDDLEISYSEAISVRPAVPYRTKITAGAQQSGTRAINLDQTLRSELGRKHVSFSNSPMVITEGLIAYLDHFPHACTEQLVSQEMPLLAHLYHPTYLGTPDSKRERLQQLIAELRSRQTNDGGFGLWSGIDRSELLPSLHTIHFLTDVRRANLLTDEPLYLRSLQYLRAIASQASQSLQSARNRAYAIYLLTREGALTTNYLVDLNESLEQAKRPTQLPWQDDITAVWMAASYQLLQMQANATQLMSNYKTGRSQINDKSVYDSPLIHDLAYLYLVAEHFPSRLQQIDSTQMIDTLKPLLEGRINTLSAAWGSLVLTAFHRQVGSLNSSEINVAWTDSENQSTPLELNQGLFFSSDIPDAAAQLTVSNQQPLFFSLEQGGFKKDNQATAISEGIEIERRYLTQDGEPIEQFSIGQTVTVVLQIRTLKQTNLDQIAVVDLLPTGFRVERDSLLRDSRWRSDYADIRDDRIIFYGSFGPQVSRLTYQATVTTAGQFTAPVAYAQSMYDTNIFAQTATTNIKVEAR